MSGPDTTIGDLLSGLDRTFPFAWAEPWDNVGMLVGDPADKVGKVLVSLDVTRASVARAVAAGAGVLLTHHPATAEPLQRLAPGHGPEGVVFEAARSGLALIAAHTNLDRSPQGAAALPRALGLEVVAPLEQAVQEVLLVTTYVPKEDVDRVMLAMSLAGAGRIGRYEGCAYVLSDGEGRFTPMEGTSPYVGKPGSPERTPESRLEMVCPPSAEKSVMAAARQSHPYEEPVIVASPSKLARGEARMGRLCEAPVPTLGELADRVSERLDVFPRVWGEPSRSIARIAVAPGSGRSFVKDALAAGADVMLTGELRYHDSLAAVESGLAVIEAGHDATEWPLVPVLAEGARASAGLPEEAVVLDEPSVAWWVARRSR